MSSIQRTSLTCIFANIINREEVVGSGLKSYKVASDIILNLKTLDPLNWAELVYLAEDIERGIVCATLTKCYGLAWSFNPCRLVNRIKDAPLSSGMYSQV